MSQSHVLLTRGRLRMLLAAGLLRPNRMSDLSMCCVWTPWQPARRVQPIWSPSHGESSRQAHLLSPLPFRPPPHRGVACKWP